MEYEIYYSPDAVEDADPANRGLDAGLERVVARLREAGAEYRVVDTGELSVADRQEAYARAVLPSVHKKYRVRSVFGTRKYAGTRFGRDVPALLVLEDGRPVDVYPHEEQDGTVVTITEYVERRFARAGGAESERRRELLEKMAALRREIGPIGVTTTELLREARIERGEDADGKADEDGDGRTGA
jgi:hypothetical protein